MISLQKNHYWHIAMPHRGRVHTFSNWFNTNEYAMNGNYVFRGVQILDSKARERLLNIPFLHNHRIEEFDRRTSGGLRKAARLLKSLKYDSDVVNLSSYDVVSIACNIPEWQLNVPRSKQLLILDACLEYYVRLVGEDATKASIEVPDGHRKVFETGHATFKGLKQLASELADLKQDVLSENARSFTNLREARIEY